MSLHQTIAWIEQKEARILSMENGLHHVSTVDAPVSLEVSDPSTGNDEAIDLKNAFFYKVARALDTADEILIVGPSATKTEFVNYMHKNDHSFDPRILGVETIDNPDDHKLVGYAKLYFTDGGPRRSGHGSGYKGTE